MLIMRCIVDWLISIHAPRTGSDLRNDRQDKIDGDISIHAPRTGSDIPRGLPAGQDLQISIHAPRTGSDVCHMAQASAVRRFQSTLPARGATCRENLAGFCRRYFNPRSPHGERPFPFPPAACRRHFNPRSPHGERLVSRIASSAFSRISIHAPRTGSDAHR